MTINSNPPGRDRDAAINTDRELWRERDDYYADSIHVTEGGGIGINCGGTVIVKPLRDWHRLACADELDAALRELPPTTQEGLDRAYVIAASALGYHEKNRTSASWNNLFSGVVDALGPHVSRAAADEAQRNHEDGCLDAQSY